MKKLLLFKKMIIVVLLVGLSSAGWAQILYEGFNYATPAYIGGNGDPGSTSNNWVTHSVTAGETTTMDINDGSLTYTGFAASTGNKVYLFSNSNATSRDVNRAFTTTATTLYYSALINIIDNTQINTFDNYFMHFGATAGMTNTTFGARLGVVKSADGLHFQFNIGNNSGGTPVFTHSGTDLDFGTTYLVVVKYDASVSPTVATLWINPATLGGTEPTGGITNSTGTNPFPTFASICLRNNGTTPKAYIDEIRVGTTWADVTPFSGVGLSNKDQSLRQTSIYPNPATTFFNVKAPEGKYLVSINNAIGSVVKTSEVNTTGKIEVSDLNPGLYFVTVENVKTNKKEVHKLFVK